jgi:hypothetical protein
VPSNLGPQSNRYKAISARHKSFAQVHAFGQRGSVIAIARIRWLRRNRVFRNDLWLKASRMIKAFHRRTQIGQGSWSALFVEVAGSRASDSTYFQSVAHHYEVLNAPALNRKVDGKFDLLVENKHSFPALLHLAIFTDIMNIYQFDPYDHYFGIRTLRNHHRMRWAVRSGILISVLTLAGVIALLARSTITVLLRRDSRDIRIFIVLLFCVAWFANIVAFLPFVPNSYMGGYWTPRLLAPALIGFFIPGFTFLDRSRWVSRK